MNVSELYSRCAEMAASEPRPEAVRYLHQTLVLACAEALKGSGQAFGNLFAQVDFLCKRSRLSVRDRISVQDMRRHSNARDVPSREDWLYDIRALARFIAAVYQTDIPHELLTRIPAEPRPVTPAAHTNLRYVRCVVESWDEGHLYASTADGPVCVDSTDAQLAKLLRPGMQLNLLDCHADGTTIQPGLVVVEPDYLVDISSIAACFQDYGHHPLSYLLGRLRPRANTQQMLLGNLAGSVLDDVINQPSYQLSDTIRGSFREQALQFCTCEGFAPQRFKADAASQSAHIREAVSVLFGGQEAAGSPAYDRSKALLEPSFVCEQLGLQGRVDLMTADMRLLVEQKSGKNWNIERPQFGQKGLQKEDHYVQLLLYYGVLRYNFHLTADQVDIRLLYSKYPARQGLVVVNYYQQLFREAVRLRNRIVAQEVGMARDGFGSLMPQLRTGLLLENRQKADFFDRYIRPEAEHVFQPFLQLKGAERDYVERMMTFACREQLAQKVGVQEGQGGAQCDLWHMPLADKLDTGNILLGTLARRTADTVVLSIDTTATLPNFRRGDMVYAYRYEQVPDVRAYILYKGVIQQLTATEVTVRLNDAQQNATLFTDGNYAVEHASSDVGSTSAMRSLHAFCVASPQKRQLLLGLAEPRRDPSRQLSRSYHAHYDEVLLAAFQALDYFLLQGPPGTGKTSMALRFMVQEELARGGTLLLMAYTHRAVDEICGMLSDAAVDFLRLGSETSCDPRFVPHLLDYAMGSQPRLSDMQHRLQQVRVVVSTTSTMQARPFLLQLRSFSLCIVDEASQILEPNIIGLLSSDRISRFILVGDHKQLPAVVQQPDDEPRLHACRQALFERLLSTEREAGRSSFTATLRRQGRMHPDIAAFPNEMFYQREQLECVPCQHQLDTTLHYDQPPQDELDRLMAARRVLFLPSEPCRSVAVSDKVNQCEACIVADLLRRVLRQYGSRFDADRTVGVIVPYRNQIAMIRREVARLGLPQLSQVSIDTVERYQGSQRDVIIYSFTVQQPYQLDFLTSNSFEEDGRVIDRRLNVAMTRARKQLIMTGNVATLSRNPVFAELIRRYAVVIRSDRGAGEGGTSKTAQSADREKKTGQNFGRLVPSL